MTPPSSSAKTTPNQALRPHSEAPLKYFPSNTANFNTNSSQKKFLFFSPLISEFQLEFNVWDKVADKNAKVYVYCKTAGRSALATKTLNDLGYKNAVLMDAQFEEWIKAGYPVER